MGVLVPKVFIGSSSEGKIIAQLIQDILTENDIESVGWWEESVFLRGETFIESLHRLISEHNFGLFIATPDDFRVTRNQGNWTPRDNVLLEYGMFSGVHGRRRIVIASIGDLELPSDLEGVNVLRLKNENNIFSIDKIDIDKKRKFKHQNKPLVLDWIFQNQNIYSEHTQNLFELFPQVADVLVNAVSRMKDQSDENVPQRDLDLLASDMIGAIASTLDISNYGINEALVEKVGRLVLPSCTGIHAVDVIGPKGWIHPKTYRYLAPQIRRYIQSNTDQKGSWNLQVSPNLREAIELAINNAIAKEVLEESKTIFDNPDYLQWSENENPKMEFSRTLLWSKRELLSPITEAVIAIHVAFNVPLFFVECDEDSKERNVDYIYFKVTGRIEGFYGLRQDNYRTRDIRAGRIPHIGYPHLSYATLLKSEKLLLAHDARYLALEGNI